MESVNDVLNSIFNKIKVNFNTQQWLSDRAILAPRNDQVTYILT